MLSCNSDESGDFQKILLWDISWFTIGRICKKSIYVNFMMPLEYYKNCTKFWTFEHWVSKKYYSFYVFELFNCKRFPKFLFGQEINIFNKSCQRWWWGGGGKKRYSCFIPLFEYFWFSIFQIKMNKIGVLHLKNFHFSLSIFKNGVKNGVKTLFCMIAEQWAGCPKNDLVCCNMWTVLTSQGDIC